MSNTVLTDSSVRDLILNAHAPTVEKLEIDNLGTLYIRELSGMERDRLEKDLKDNKIDPDAPGWRARLAAMYLCDETGKRIFNIKEDIALLSEKPQSLLDAIIVAGNKLNKYGAKEIDAATGN